MRMRCFISLPWKGFQNLRSEPGASREENSLFFGMKKIQFMNKKKGVNLSLIYVYCTGWFRFLSSFTPLPLDLKCLLQNLACTEENKNNQCLKNSSLVQLSKYKQNVMSHRLHFTSHRLKFHLWSAKCLYISVLNHQLKSALTANSGLYFDQFSALGYSYWSDSIQTLCYWMIQFLPSCVAACSDRYHLITVLSLLFISARRHENDFCSYRKAASTKTDCALLTRTSKTDSDIFWQIKVMCPLLVMHDCRQ